MGRRKQCGGGYSVPWDVGRSGQRRHGQGIHHMRIRCRLNVHTKLPVRSHVASRLRGGIRSQLHIHLSGGKDNKERKICLGKALSTTPKSMGFLQ